MRECIGEEKIERECDGLRQSTRPPQNTARHALYAGSHNSHVDDKDGKRE